MKKIKTAMKSKMRMATFRQREFKLEKESEKGHGQRRQLKGK